MKSILVVDDQLVVRELVRQTLEIWQEGLDIEEAANGMEAMVNLESRSYDLMICDVRMPLLDGIGVLKKVRETEGMKDMPVIMLTAADEPDNIVDALRLGATSYVTKPFNLVDLLAALNARAEESAVS